jgi:hypothetical protein
MKKNYYLFSTLLMVFFAQTLFAQSVTISGTVTEKGNGSPLPGVGVFIQGATAGGVTDFDGYDDFGNSTGDYDVQDNNINLSLATRTGKFLWGSSIKMLFDNINDEKKSGFGIDLGAMYEMNEYISFGAHVRDLYSKFDDVSIPMQYNLGVAVFPIKGLTVSGDLRQEESRDEITVHMGAEYWASVGTDTDLGSGMGTMRNTNNLTWDDMLSQVQAGVRIGANDGQFTAGFGIRFKMIEMNYAYVREDSKGINDDNHRYGLTFRF